MTTPGVPSLTQRRPVVPPDRLLAELVPPRHFADESFATYRPDPAHPSQAAAVTRLSAAAEQIRRGGQKSFWKRGKTTPVAVYLDGGFGVGKTHLLTSLAARGRRPGRGLRHVRRVHQPRRRPRVPADRRGPRHPPAGLHRRVRAGRPGRHRPHVPPAARARRPRASRSPPRRTPCPARWARAGSPPTTSCARSRRSPPGSRSCASTATTTGTGRSSPTPTALDDDEVRAAAARRDRTRPWTTSATCSRTSRPCTPAATAPCSTASGSSA